MKTFNYLTEIEKVNLTEEKVEFYARLECANRGVIIPQKPIGTKISVENPKTKFYSIGYESRYFDNESDAELYADLIYNRAFNASSIGSNFDGKSQYAKKGAERNAEVKSSFLYTEEEFNSLKDALKNNSEVDKEFKEYNESITEYNLIVNEIWNEISDINFKNQRQSFFEKTYSDYLELAENNNSIAYGFFEKAYKNANLSDVDQDIIKQILIDKNVPESVEEKNCLTTPNNKR